MVRLTRVWRAVFRMGHPQVRWSWQLMTQDEGTTEQFQADDEGTGIPPLNSVECGKVQRRSSGLLTIVISPYYYHLRSPLSAPRYTRSRRWVVLVLKPTIQI